MRNKLLHMLNKCFMYKNRCVWLFPVFCQSNVPFVIINTDCVCSMCSGFFVCSFELFGTVKVHRTYPEVGNSETIKFQRLLLVIESSLVLLHTYSWFVFEECKNNSLQQESSLECEIHSIAICHFAVLISSTMPVSLASLKKEQFHCDYYDMLQVVRWVTKYVPRTRNGAPIKCLYDTRQNAGSFLNFCGLIHSLLLLHSTCFMLLNSFTFTMYLCIASWLRTWICKL